MAWFPSHPTVHHLFDLDEVLSLPVNFLAADLPPADEVELPVAAEAEVIDAVCSICTEGFNTGEGDGKRVPCGHVYHSACISTWLSRCNSCPLCRAQVFVIT